MAEIRTDPITGRRVIIAAERAHRPKQLSAASQSTVTEACPFCSGNEAMTPVEICADRSAASLPDTPGWSVRVVPNKYPALTSDATAIPMENTEPGPAGGVHEVIIESPEHVANLSSLSQEQFAKIVFSYRQRLRQHYSDHRWRYGLVYKNQGDRAGATLEHVHSQIIALPFVPQEVRQKLNRLGEHFKTTGNCHYCQFIEMELRAQQRIVAWNETFIAFCPYAPRFAYETWILPRAHGAAFARANDAEITAFAAMLRQIVSALEQVQENAPFNYLIESPVVEKADAAAYHWHLELLPQFARAAGFEWGTGMHINPVAPEEAARVLARFIPNSAVEK